MIIQGWICKYLCTSTFLVIYLHGALLPLSVVSSNFELLLLLCSMEACNRCSSWALSEKFNDADAVSPTRDILRYKLSKVAPQITSKRDVVDPPVTKEGHSQAGWEESRFKFQHTAYTKFFCMFCFSRCRSLIWRYFLQDDFWWIC